jgi:hypothetical protein
MERKNINGFSFKLFNFIFEIVTIKKIPRIFTISKPINKTIFRRGF